jgi:hypothetical protein
VFKIDAATGERLGLLATGIVGEGECRDLMQPIIARAKNAIIVWPRC